MYASQAVMLPDNEWVFFILGRIGESLLHTFNGGLIGWALAKTWQDKGLSCADCLFNSDGVHALWNFNVFCTQLLPAVQGNEPNNMFSIGLIVGLGLIIVIGFALLMVYISKRKTRTKCGLWQVIFWYRESAS